MVASSSQLSPVLFPPLLDVDRASHIPAAIRGLDAV